MTMTRAGEWWIAPGLVLVAVLNALCYPLIVVASAYALNLALASLHAATAGLALAAIATFLRRSLQRSAWSWLTLSGIEHWDISACSTPWSSFRRVWPS